ncbi:MAG: TIR domain-containing protein [Terracidiphilus sp.]
MPESPSVFISYSTKDLDAAKAILGSLEEAGIRCWVAFRDIQEGEVWEDAIIRGISNCRVVLCLLSSNANKSRQVQREIHFAFEVNDKPVIPVRLEDIPPSGALAYHLASLQSLDASSRPIDGHLWKIVARVQAVLTTVKTDPATDEAPPLRSVIQPVIKRKWPWKTLLSGTAIVIAMLAAGYWYRHRPLPPFHLGNPVPITSDESLKALAGTDGSRLYFTEPSPNRVRQVAIAGGAVASIPVAGGGSTAIVFDVSPDGSTLLVASGEEGNSSHVLWTATTHGDPLHRIGVAQGAAFSQDGRQIAFITPDGDLFVGGADGAVSQKIANVGSSAYRPVWSHDGSTIRFDKDNALWEISSNGSNLHQLLLGWHTASAQCCGRWTPDGSFFLFISGISLKSGGQIWALDERRPDASKKRPEPLQLTFGSDRWKYPIASNDSKTVFAVRLSETGQLSSFDAQSKQFKPFMHGIPAESVTFSRDGKYVAYVSFPDGILFRANRDGSNPRQLSDQPRHPEVASWSPDGVRIAFMDTSLGSTGPEIYTVASEGGGATRILNDDTEQERDPSWSLDSNRIVFLSGKPRTMSSELRIFDFRNFKVNAVPESHGFWSPRWSPDDKYIAAINREENRLMVYSFEKRQWRTISTGGQLNFPAWSSDSKWIFYLHLENGNRGVFKVNVNGGQPQQVADLQNTPLTGTFNQWMGLDPTNAPLLLIAKGGDDIYSLPVKQK